MKRDIRQSIAFQAVEGFYEDLFAPGVGHVHAVEEAVPASGGTHCYITGTAFQESLPAGPSQRLYRVDLASGELEDLFHCPGRLPRPAPMASLLACVLKREGGVETLCIANAEGTVQFEQTAEGLIEQLAWSPDGGSLLLVIAGEGADLAGYQGGYALATEAEGPDWLPAVDGDDDSGLWRSLWVLRVGEPGLRRVSRHGVNVWEAAWMGDQAAVAICSDDHGEGSWYGATLRRLAIEDGAEQELFRPADQIGLPVGSPDGRRAAFVEAVASDRGILCGRVKVADLEGRVRPMDTGDVEVTSLTWRSDDLIHCAGQAGFDTVVGDIALDDGRLNPAWISREMTCGNWYPWAQPLSDGRSLVATEAYTVAPALAIIDGGRLSIVKSFEAPRAGAAMRDRGSMEPLEWTAPDGLTIQGWLVRPEGEGGFPLVLDIHGGPVWASRNRWMGRGRATPLLVGQGCAVLYPNPRGSSTRGQDFAARVRGDMGGADADDLIAAVDHLVHSGFADVDRLACTGTSYGGFMSCWLATKDNRFAAAAPISPVTNWFSQHRTSQIPHFDMQFLDGSVCTGDGLFFQRSPVMFAHQVRTPCLIMAGALDRNTPPSQALEFHQSVREAGVESVLATYPHDGHSLRGYPAYIDSAARIILWFTDKLGLPAPG